MLSSDPTRRRFLSTLALASLAPATSSAVEETTTLNLTVEKDRWGNCSLDDIHTVLLAAVSEIWKYCPGERMRPIRIYHREDYPQTDFLHDWHGRTHIGLACEDAHWPQMAFQIGHEFCHCLAQHSFAAKRSWHPPQHANLWFEESLCETASLFVLKRLSETWRTAPPGPQWRDCSAGIAAFGTDRLARPAHQLYPGVNFSSWFKDNETKLRACAVLREKDVIIARQMLPLFEAQPEGWQAACYLNLGARQPTKPLTQYFAEWQAASPPSLRPFLQRIAALFVSGTSTPERTSAPAS